MFSFHEAQVKQDIYLQSHFENDVSLVCNTILISERHMAAATDYLRSVNERTS
jgi:hypothetical protein